MARRRKRPPLEPSSFLAELASADNPPTRLEPYLGQLADAGATALYVARSTDKDALFEISSLDQARGGRAFVNSGNGLVIASWPIDLEEGDTPLHDALEGVVAEFVAFDRIARLRFAESDMKLVAHAAAALAEARAQRGAARLFERVIETGMVVTYARPFLPSNQAGLGKRWWPQDEAGRALHEELIDLRGEYHAHAEHTPQRRLEMATGFTESRRPLLLESWSRLPGSKLRLLEEVAERQAARFGTEADRLDLELFGPVERLVRHADELDAPPAE